MNLFHSKYIVTRKKKWATIRRYFQKGGDEYGNNAVCSRINMKSYVRSFAVLGKMLQDKEAKK
jgi:hypothetical protein